MLIGTLLQRTIGVDLLDIIREDDGIAGIFPYRVNDTSVPDGSMEIRRTSLTQVKLQDGAPSLCLPCAFM